MVSLADLPEETLIHIGMLLDAPDVLGLIQASTRFHRCLDLNCRFWEQLGDRQSCPAIQGEGRKVSTQDYKDRFLQGSYCERLSRVEWKGLSFREANVPGEREGHVACSLGGVLVVTGGYSSSRAVYLKEKGFEWQSIVPASGIPEFTYGASLTKLDEERAILFGGFCAGGYSNETTQLAVLTVKRTATPNQFDVRWDIKKCKYEAPDTQNIFASKLARAYHTATLLHNRYLLVVGGMQAVGSILDPYVLDVLTWMWLNGTVIENHLDASPSARHGHSLVLDDARDRFVMFGGGSGSDLLRSGRDTASVWSLKLGSNWREELLQSLPWRWEVVHSDNDDADDDDTDAETSDGGDDHDDDGSERIKDDVSLSKLSPSEKLVLGRCHAAHKVSRDSVMLLFGSGRPSTNGVLGYNLASDCFIRPIVRGPIPQARFTFCSVLLPSGHIFVHSGYGNNDTIEDMVLLDLCPAVKNRDTGLMIDPNVQSSNPITDDDVEGGRRPDGFLFEVLSAMSGLAPEEQRLMAGRIVLSMHIGGRDDYDARLLHLIASGDAAVETDRDVGFRIYYITT